MFNWLQIITLTPSLLTDNTADCERLRQGLHKKLQIDFIHIDLSLLKKIPFYIRQWDYQVACLVFRDANQWVLVELFDPLHLPAIIGLAIDLGTTRISLRLIDLITTHQCGELTFNNPQISIGADILTRLHFAKDAQGLEKLNHLLIDSLNMGVQSLCLQNQLTREDIFLVTLAGNTSMTHLFLGLPPDFIIQEPYIPAINAPDIIKTSTLGLKFNPQAHIFIFPNIGSYFGGDLLAGILFSGMYKQEETAILVDVGTNAEVVAGNCNWMAACAGAAGPALESGAASMGMMAAPGVIDRVKVNPDGELILHTISDKTPIGICGSGLIDLTAQLFLAGMLDIRGQLVEDDTLLLTDKLSISQIEFNSLIRSKAAMFTILETLTLAVGLKFSEIDCFYVAGTFGVFINPQSAITIGMLPDLPLDVYQPLGNSSLEGAVMFLTSYEHAPAIAKIRDNITYLELNVNQDFMNRFSAAKFLPHTTAERFPSVKIPKA